MDEDIKQKLPKNIERRKRLASKRNISSKFSDESPPRRRSARLIAISKPTIKEIEEDKNESCDQFEPLNGLGSNESDRVNGKSDSTKILFDENVYQSECKQKTRNTKKVKSKKENITGQIPFLNINKDEEKSNDATKSAANLSTAFLSQKVLFNNDGSQIQPTTSSAYNLLHSVPFKRDIGQELDSNKQIAGFNSSDDGEDEWEALEPVHKTGQNSVVQVFLEGEIAEKFKTQLNPLDERNAKEAEERAKWEREVRLEIARRKRELQEDLHRIHTLGYVAHLYFLVATLNRNKELLTGKLNAVLKQSEEPLNSDQMNKMLNTVFLQYFCKLNEVVPEKAPQEWSRSESALIGHLIKMIELKGFNTAREITMLFFAYCSFLLRLPTRICVAFNPLPRLVNNVKQPINNRKKKCQNYKSDNIQKSKKEVNPAKKGRKCNKKKMDTSDSEKTDIDDDELEHKSAALKNKDIAQKEVIWQRDYWNEYWDELERRWICVDPFYGVVDSPGEIEEKSGRKICYVFALDNEYGLSEIAGKYVSNFLDPITRKLRTNADWLAQILQFPFLRQNEKRARLEKAAIHEHLKSKPLPLRVADYKNHPIYVLERDLLKFEAIYPPDTPPVGRIGDHNVFPRSAVHKLEGSLNWIKVSRSIKEGEKPYKVVKARPKTNIPKEQRKPLTLDLFGYWQTEPYRPPEVVEGRIPRNEFGNIYMYKEEMLPKACAHLRLPGIFQLARRLNMEAVPAVVGWEFSGGFNHPILDGCVVLQNDEETLRSAWRETAKNKAEKESKRENDRIWKNWRRLICGKKLLEDLKKRFK